MQHSTNGFTTHGETSVRERYSAAAQTVEPALCCPVDYRQDLLAPIPEEVLEKDYGCGDPSRHVRPGETVVDLGSGAGKLCFIMAQVVGSDGQVIGVDCNREMMAVARANAPTVSRRIGYDNVMFRYGMIQDLRLDLEALSRELSEQPVQDADAWLALRSLEDRLRSETPMISDESVDCVVSNCVLNLVRSQDRRQLFTEIFRVLKRGGRAAISDIVSDEEVPQRLRRDPDLWSGCISGAFREDKFLEAFEDAGFHGLEVIKRQPEPWRTVEGIEFRSITVMAHKGKQGPCLERKQAVIYRGPYRKVEDDDGHVFPRGQRIAVCDKTYHLLQKEPYDGAFDPVPPREEVPPDDAQPFNCRRTASRSPSETKGDGYSATTEATESCCDDAGQCC